MIGEPTDSGLMWWAPQHRREPDPRQGELFHAVDGLPQPTAMMPEWIGRAAASDLQAELNPRRTWGLRRRLRWALGSKR